MASPSSAGADPVISHMLKDCASITESALSLKTLKGSPVEAALGTDGVYDMINTIFESVNPGLVYGNVQDKGFVAVKMTEVRFYK
jgi:hypothetical protein